MVDDEIPSLLRNTQPLIILVMSEHIKVDAYRNRRVFYLIFLALKLAEGQYSPLWLPADQLQIHQI